VSDFIELKQKHAAVTLADARSYELAAERLGLSVPELKAQIDSLESKLCLLIFELSKGRPSLTQDGRYLIELFREALSRHEGK
jgi:DNA-binding transcriptional LysR family regulator